MKKNLLAIAAFALLLTSCETKLVEKVDLIPLAENVEIHKGAFPIYKAYKYPMSGNSPQTIL